MANGPGFLKRWWGPFSLLLVLVTGLWAQPKPEFDESFNPTSLRDWPSSQAKIEVVKPLTDYQLDLGDSLPVFEERPDYIYRVQLGSTDDYEKAIQLESGALDAFDEQVILAFDSPYYKIRVGRLSNREDAQVLQQQAVRKGYRRAWVVRTDNDEPIE